MKHHRSWTHPFLALVILFSSLAFSLASVQPVSAQSGTWYVSTLGSDENACNAPELPCLTINAAIAKAASGDTIKVAIGTYTSDAGNEVVLIDKSISLSGGWDEGFTARSGVSTIDGNGARRGITVNSAITTAIEHFTIQNGILMPSSIAGGIFNSNGTLTVNNSSIINNKSVGIYNNNGTLALNNTTVSGSEIGIQTSGPTTITNSTINNRLYTTRGTSILQNTILSSCSVGYAKIISQGYNLISDTTDCLISPTTGDQFNVDPQLGLFVEQTGTFPLAPTSPAIDAGNNDTCFGTTDQRGQPRADGPDEDYEVTCDIGAYEYAHPGEPASIHLVSGGDQRTPPYMTFFRPFKVMVLDDIGSPVEGSEVVFTAPSNGASGTFHGESYSISVFADGFGIATAPIFSANGEYGEYVVTAAAIGLGNIAEFKLENGGWFVSPNGSDTNDCKFPSSPCATINGAISKASNGDTIGVAAGIYTGSGTEVILINKSINLSAGWDETFTVQDGTSTIDGGGARMGININTAVTTTIERFTVQNGYLASAVAGGIYNYKGVLTVNNSSIINNKLAGIYNGSGTLVLNNSTVSDNETGVHSFRATTIITSSTILDSLNANIGSSILQNTILSSCSVSNAKIISQGYNLISDTTDCLISPTTGDQFNVDPQLGLFVEQTGAFPLAPTSPAIDAGNNDTCFGTTDQRGQPRADGPDEDYEVTCDIGAYEYAHPGEPASIHPVSGARQSTFPNTTFPQLLKARVLDDVGTPVEGIEIGFTAPPDGASGTFKGDGNSISVLVDGFGVATTPAFIANGEYGEYMVTATTSGLSGMAEFKLENGGWFVSSNGSDTNDCKFPSTPCRTINAAITKALDGDIIKVAIGTYTAASGSQVVLINKSITLSGGWDKTFTTQNGTSTIDGGGSRRGINITSGSTVVVENLKISNGLTNYGDGGGIYNSGTLKMKNSIVSGNVGWHGGGIYNSGTLTINDSAIIGNTAGRSDYGSGAGGGIRNSSGTVTLNNSTISGNKLIGHYSGSGIDNSGKFILNNSTVSGNIGGDGDGIAISRGTVLLISSTITMNQTRGVTNISGNLTLQNTIIAKNGANGDCYNSSGERMISKGYNLIGNGTGCSFTPSTGDLVGTSSKPIDPRLGPLQNNGGPTFTHALYTTSPAVDAGNPAQPGSGENACLLKDQRGVIRPKGKTCDIGAYEGSVLKVIPTLFSPRGIIIDATPTFRWDKLSKTTQYQYLLLKGKKVIFTKTVSTNACGASQCSSTPTIVLDTGTYTWKVRALTNGKWQRYSPAMKFQLFPAKPGFWRGQWTEFYVTTTGPKVDNFAVYIRVYGCGSYKITHTPLLPIVDKKFSFGGSFYANGIFAAPTKASGTLGLNRFYIPGCGYVTGGPFPWTAVWKNGKQPTITVEAIDDLTINLLPDLQLLPELQLPFDAFTVEPLE